MSVAVRSIMRRFSRKPGSKYNILCMPTHERYETGLAKTGHNFYAWNGQGIKRWNPIYGAVPKNYTLLDGGLESNQLPDWVDFDFILCQSNGGQYNVSSQLSKILHLPILRLEHTTVMPNWTKQMIQHLKDRMPCHLNVFISDWSREQWGFDSSDGHVVEHGVDTELFSPDRPIMTNGKILTVANEYPQRDWCLGFRIYTEVTRDLPTRPVGDSPGFSKPAASIDELVNEYRSASVFLNTSTFSPVPTSLLEAMSCGCAVVSTATGAIPTIIENGVNGYATNDKNEMRRLLIKLLSNPSERKRLGEAARKTVLDRYGMSRFIEDWQKIFNLAANLVYTG